MIKIIPGIISLILVFQGFNLYQKKTFKQSILDGQEIYYDFCVRCHLPSGIGEQGRVPPLAESDYLINNKVPLAEKPDYKILEDGNNSIIAVLFPSNKFKDVSHYGIPSDQQKCTQATTLVLQIGLKSSTN